jgi:hypothetical protein
MILVPAESVLQMKSVQLAKSAYAVIPLRDRPEDVILDFGVQPLSVVGHFPTKKLQQRV